MSHLNEPPEGARWAKCESHSLSSRGVPTGRHYANYVGMNKLDTATLGLRIENTEKLIEGLRWELNVYRNVKNGYAEDIRKELAIAQRKHGRLLEAKGKV